MTRASKLVVLLAIVSVVLITILPLPHLQGPRTATEGPATTFSSARFFLLLLAMIQIAGNLVVGYCRSRQEHPRTASPSSLSVVLLC